MYFSSGLCCDMKVARSRLPPACASVKWCDGKEVETRDAAPLYGQHLLELEAELVLYKSSYIVLFLTFR